jgi:hypothetical protein
MQLFFRFVQVGSSVLIVGVASLILPRADCAAIQQRCGPFERQFRHAQRGPCFPIFQLGCCKGRAIEQQQPVAFLDLIAKVGVHGHDMAGDSCTELG